MDRRQALPPGVPLLLLALAACTAPKDAPDTGDPAAVGVIDPTLTPSPAIPTVATLTFTTDAPVRTAVRYGTDARTLDTPVEASPGTTHSFPLVGVPAATDATWEIVDESGTALATGAWTTGPLPTGVPALTATGDGNDQFVFTSLVGTTRAAVLLSPEGEIVWWHATDPELDTLRVRPASDGSGVWYNSARVNGDLSEDSALVKVSWDGTAVTEFPLPRLTHDFVERPDGTLATLQARFPDDDPELRGDAIVEVAADGTPTDAWTSWDCFDPTTTPGDTPTLGWTFANALDYDAATGGYVVGLRNLSSLAWIDRATRTCTAVLGGDASTYTFVGDTFRHEHQFETWDAEDGRHVLVFDNDGAGAESRVIEYVLDGTVATEVWSYTADPSIYAFVLGDVARLDDGDTFVAWSVAGRLERVAPDGTVAWRLDADLGGAFGFTTLAERPLP